MPDLDARLREVRSIAGPDLWEAIEERASQTTLEDAAGRGRDPGRDGAALPSHLGPRGSRWIAIGLAAAIAIASTVFVVRDLRFRGPVEPAAGASIVATIPLSSAGYSMGFADGSVWILTERGVLRVDAATNRVVARTRIFGGRFSPNELGATPYGIFVSKERRGLVRIDPASNDVVARWSFTADFVSAATDAVWVTSPNAGVVVRIDPATDRIVARVPVPGRPTGVFASDRAVWVVNDHPKSDRESMTRIDPSTNQVAQVVPLDAELAEEVVGTADGRVWVAGCAATSDTSCTWSAIALDALDGRVVVRRPLGAKYLAADPADLHAAWGDQVWGSAADNYVGITPASGTVFALDTSGRLRWTLDVGMLIGDVTYGDGSVWVAEGGDARLVRIDPGT